MHPNGEAGTTTNHGITGHEQLDETFLTHMNGRIYDYRLGRFLSVDLVIGNPANSQAINPYSYLGNNPFSGVDPSGYECAGQGFSECTTTIINGPGPQKDDSKKGTIVVLQDNGKRTVLGYYQFGKSAAMDKLLSPQSLSASTSVIESDQRERGIASQGRQNGAQFKEANSTSTGQSDAGIPAGEKQAPDKGSALTNRELNLIAQVLPNLKLDKITVRTEAPGEVDKATKETPLEGVGASGYSRPGQSNEIVLARGVDRGSVEGLLSVVHESGHLDFINDPVRVAAQQLWDKTDTHIIGDYWSYAQSPTEVYARRAEASAAEIVSKTISQPGSCPACDRPRP
jgi:RHS repeat-associated protein